MGLNEAFASAMQGAAAKGTELLAQPVEVAFKGLNQGGWDLLGGLKDVSLGVPVSFSRDVAGGGMLFLSKGYAALMGELMMGNEPAEMPALSDMNSTAAAEVISQMVAVIGDSANAASIGLHRALGFEDAGMLRSVGFKHGRWVDTVLMQRALGPGGTTLPPRDA